MSQTSVSASSTDDPVSNVLKWILLAVAVVTFGLMAWATVATYERAPPQPERFVSSDGSVVMTDDDLLAGKAGFQKADLMDYGSLYGMGSYYGEDYTASTLVRVASLTRDNYAQSTQGAPFQSLNEMQQAAATAAMRKALNEIDLTKQTVVLPPEVATAIDTEAKRLAQSFHETNPTTGWTPAW